MNGGDSALYYNGVTLTNLQTQAVEMETVYDQSDTDALYTKITFSAVFLIVASEQDLFKNPNFRGGLPTGTVPTSNLPGTPGVQPDAILPNAGSSAGLTGELPLMGAPAPVPPAQPSDLGPADVIARVRHLLLVPRRALTIVLGGRTFAYVPEGRYDAANGPKPKRLKIQQVTPESFSVEYTIEFCVIDCVSPLGQGSRDRAVLSLKWKQTQTVDETWYSTLETTGYLIVRSDFAKLDGNITWTADGFRKWIGEDGLPHYMLPPIPPGFMRQESKYTLSEDGLRCDFTVRDREVFRYPLIHAGAVKCSGTYTESTTDGAIRHATVHIRAEGHRYASQTEMIKAALKVAINRFTYVGGFHRLTKETIAGMPKVLMTGKISAGIWDNTIELALTVMLPGLTVTVQGQNDNTFIGRTSDSLNRFDEEIPIIRAAPNRSPGRNSNGTDYDVGLGPSVYSPQYFGGEEQRGRQMLALITCLFRDPCLGGAQPPNRLPQPQETKVPPPTLIGFDPVQPSSPSTTSQDNTTIVPPPEMYKGSELADGTYSNYVVKLRYIKDQQKMQLPLARKPSKTSKIINPSCVVVSLAAPMMRLVAEWTATRYGGKPTLPAEQAADINVTFLRSEIMPTQVQPTGNNTLLQFTVSGVYEYAILDPEKSFMQYPLPPWASAETIYNEVDGPFSAAKSASASFEDRIALGKFDNSIMFPWTSFFGSGTMSAPDKPVLLPDGGSNFGTFP